MLERLISGDNHIDLTYCPPPRPAAATTQAALPL